MTNLKEIGKALVCFHVSRASWADRPVKSYMRDVKSFKHLTSRFYNDYYGSGRFYLRNMNDDDTAYLDDDKWAFTDAHGKTFLEGRDKIEAETGTLEIDGDYDTYYVQRLEDCDEDELEIIYKEGSHHTLSDEDIQAYCCWRLDMKMIESIDNKGKSCIVHFTDGTQDEILFRKEQDVTDTVRDFFTEHGIDKRSRSKYFDEIVAEYEGCWERFTLYRANIPDVWECTDRDNGIVCRFVTHKFNETQQTQMEHEITDVMLAARLMREMADWLRENHYDIIF